MLELGYSIQYGSYVRYVEYYCTIQNDMFNYSACTCMLIKTYYLVTYVSYTSRADDMT